jgi:hypothetical protein
MGYHKDSTNSKYFLKNQLLTLKKELNMFLVPTFCEIAKNDSYIFKKLKKDPISFSVVKNGQFHLFFSKSATRMLIWHTLNPIF